jgi:GTPase SAR1 family protein
MKDIDASLASFEKYKEAYKSYIEVDLSESDTRSKLIDTLLIDVLGWDEQDIQREGHVDSGFYDYKISCQNSIFLLEAKRQFKELRLPSNHSRISIKVLLKENEEVINQLRSYAIDEGVQYGIITNGVQFIILRCFNNDGKPWKNNTALIFNGVKDIENRYIEFYENVSRQGIINNGGFKYDFPITHTEGKTVLSSIIDKDKELVRTSLNALLTPLIDKVFGEMFSEEREDDLEFVKYCFVENAETKKNKNEIERLFSDEAPELNNVIPIVNSDNLAKSIVGEINSNEISMKETYPPKPIILIGSKGAGKTTFINHLFKYKFDRTEFEKCFIIYIDFRKFYEVDYYFEPRKIAEEILESIYTKYEDLELHTSKVLKRIYFKEIKRNDESIWEYDKKHDLKSYEQRLSTFFEESKKDSLKHLTLLSHYLIRERRKRLVVIIDNADQFKDEIQEKLFVFSHSLTKSSYCGTVISLREGYYRKWQNSPPFDAYESNVYHITAPRYFEILQRRIDFAIQKTEKEKKNGVSIEISNSKVFNPTNTYIVDFLKGLKNSLFALENSALLQFANLTTFPNIREGLRVFKIFLSSGHTKIEEYIRRSQDRNLEANDRKIIPLHEFIKSLALQSRHYYNSETSIIYNLFIPPFESNDHFLKLYILSDLNDLITSQNYTEKFIQNTSLVDKITSLGYRPNVINSALISLIKSSLIDTDEQLSDVEWQEIPTRFNVTITAKGHYYLNELIYRFHYYDLVSQDTPIFNSDFYARLCNTFPQSSKEGFRNFEIRKEFVLLFFEYLEAMEAKQGNQLKVIYNNLVKRIKARVTDEISRM